MNILAIIPARGGSKGVPRKNIKKMNGLPLIAHTISTALEVKHLFHRIIVSTEDEEIAEISKNYGAEVPFLRPMEMATDKSPSIDLVKHAVLKIEEMDNITIDAVMLLQPTNPLRTKEDIINSIQLLDEDSDSVISVVRVVEHHPAYMKKINNNGHLDHYCIKEIEGTRRQDFTPYAYKRDGAIYFSKRASIIEDNTLWGNKMKAYVIPEERGIGIDSRLDWILVETLMKDLKS